MPEKILIVDDDTDTLRLVGLMFERQGYEVISASSGSQALSMARDLQPDLILLDIMMPDIDGYKVTRQLREDPQTTSLPIIMFTAKTQIDDKLLGFEVGADDYLTKPTQPRELTAHIKAVLGRTSKYRQPASQRARGFTIGVIAAKGGLGVTTMALNLGIAIQQSTKKDVIVAEFRPGQGSLALELGLLKPEGLNRLLASNVTEINPATIEAELISHNSGIRVLLSSPQPHDAQYLSATSAFETIASHLPSLARYIVLDLGASLTPITVKTIPYCDELVVVVEPVPQTVIQTKYLINDLVNAGLGEGMVQVVLISRSRSSMEPSWADVQEQLGYPISAMFTPAPELTYQASLHNIPVVLQQPDGLTAEQYFNLAKKVSERSL